MGKSDTMLTSPDNNKGFRLATHSLHMVVYFIITTFRAHSIVNDQNSIFQEAVSVQCYYTCVTSLKSNIGLKNKIRNLTRDNINQLIICTASEKLHKICFVCSLEHDKLYHTVSSCVDYLTDYMYNIYCIIGSKMFLV